MDTRRLTNLDAALMGLLSESPLSGYDVKQVFEETPLGHFSSSPGAIYPALKRLEKAGWIAGKVDSSHQARPRRVYSLSREGEEALFSWLREPLTREELLGNGQAPVLRFSLMEGRLERREVIAYLTDYARLSDEYLTELERDLVARGAGLSLHARLALELGLRGYRLQAEWARWAIQRLRASGR